MRSQEFKEGDEPEEFWDSFDGGRAEYSNVKDTGMASGFQPRLFHASNFSQDDLINDDIMILDAYSTIYVWIGNHSNDFEKRGAYKSANTYIAQVRDERDKDHTQVIEVEPGKESPNFTIMFPDWIVAKA